MTDMPVVVLLSTKDRLWPEECDDCDGSVFCCDFKRPDNCPLDRIRVDSQ